MRILLLHPDDSLENGPCQQKWDQVIDLGKGGCDFYCAIGFRSSLQELNRIAQRCDMFARQPGFQSHNSLKSSGINTIRTIFFGDVSLADESHRAIQWFCCPARM